MNLDSGHRVVPLQMTRLMTSHSSHIGRKRSYDNNEIKNAVEIILLQISKGVIIFSIVKDHSVVKK